MPLRSKLLQIMLLCMTLFGAQAAHGAGPGLGNLRYEADELFAPVGILSSPRGHGNVAMVNGYLMVIYSSDGGGASGNGGIEFWNVSDPRNPRLVVRHDNADTHGLREAHGFGFSNSYPGDYMVAQAVEGLQFWDVSDPHNVRLLRYMDLEGIERGDYSGAWWVFWQAPYVYLAGQASGLYVIDARNPQSPRLIRRLRSAELGGVNPALAYAIGNLLVIGASQSNAYATLDISDPAAPNLIQTFRGKKGYSHLFAAGMLLTSGGNGDPARMYIHRIGHDGSIRAGGSVGSSLGNGGYGSYQDGFFHSGFSNKYAKFHIAGLRQIGTGTSRINRRDEDFGQVLGNLVFVGDDHGVGSALVAHQRAPDTTGPRVDWVHPRDGAAGQALSTRVGVSMSDSIDIESVRGATFTVRTRGGAALAGKYSVQMGIVNFSPNRPLAANTTYEVIVNGMRDLTRNAGPRFTSTFTTAGSAAPPLDPEPDPDPTPRPDDGELITNARFANGGTARIGSFGAGAKLYTDRDYTFLPGHPANLDGKPYLLTRNDDKSARGDNFLRFSLSRDAAVHVLFDARARALPAWLDSGWVESTQRVATTDGGTERRLFSRRFPAGNVSLGGNADPPMHGAHSMYSVVVVPGAASAPPAPEPPPANNARPSCTLTQTRPVQRNTTVTFSARIANADSRSWDFGDGSARSSGASPSHAYTSAGRYSVVLSVSNANGRSTCTAPQIVHYRASRNAPSHSSSIIFSGGMAINVNPDNDTVSAISDASARKVWETSVDAKPRTLAVAPDGSIWVVNQDDATINVLDPQDGGLLDVIDLPLGSRPFGIAFDPVEGDAYVTLQGTGELVRLDSAGQLLDALTLGSNPRGLAISGDGQQVLVTQFIAEGERARVWSVEAARFRVDKRIALAFDLGPDTEASGRGLPNYLNSVVISPDGRQALVPSKKDNLARGELRDGRPLDFESMVRTIVSTIDLPRMREDRRARIDLNDRNMAQAIAFSPLGDVYFVATQGTNKVEVFDAYRRELLASLNTGLGPQGLATSDNGERLFVHNYMGRSVSVFETADLIAGISNAAEHTRDVKVVARERLPRQVLRGKRIFYNAADPKMSRDGYVSCASCHLDGGSDGQIWDFTQVGQGLRNTITLRGRAGTGHGRLHWSANFDEVQDFEHDIRVLAGGRGFMSNADFRATRAPLGARKQGKSAQLDALARYVSSLAEVPQSPFRAASGALTAKAKRGQKAFKESGCVDCHSGPAFTDKRRHDVGTASPSSGAALRNGGVDTPTLLGVWNTAPYLHDGSAATLQDVLADTAHVGRLSAGVKSDLAAFVRAIDSPADAPD